MPNNLVILTGCFDILHYGHAKMLNEAKRMAKFVNGETLCLVNSDKYLLNVKKRVAVKFEDRAQLLLEFGIDKVMMSDYHIPIFEKYKDWFKLYVNTVIKYDCDEVKWCIRNNVPIYLVSYSPISSSQIISQALGYSVNQKNP